MDDSNNNNTTKRPRLYCSYTGCDTPSRQRQGETCHYIVTTTSTSTTYLPTSTLLPNLLPHVTSRNGDPHREASATIDLAGQLAMPRPHAASAPAHPPSSSSAATDSRPSTFPSSQDASLVHCYYSYYLFYSLTIAHSPPAVLGPQSLLRRLVCRLVESRPLLRLRAHSIPASIPLALLSSHSPASTSQASPSPRERCGKGLFRPALASGA